VPGASGEDLAMCSGWMEVLPLSDLTQELTSVALVGVDLLWRMGLGHGVM
jgi:hypothetical protein